MSTNVMVVDGDNKFALIAQLFDVGRYDGRTTFVFKILDESMRDKPKPGNLEVEAHIHGISAADKDGEAWYVFGEFTLQDTPAWFNDMFWVNHSSAFHGVYNTRSRRGSLLPGKIDMVGLSVR